MFKGAAKEVVRKARPSDWWQSAEGIDYVAEQKARYHNQPPAHGDRTVLQEQHHYRPVSTLQTQIQQQQVGCRI